MALHMAANPSNPDNRVKMDLDPRSYAEAVEQRTAERKQGNRTSPASSTNGANNFLSLSHSNSSGHSSAHGKFRVLRIVDEEHDNSNSEHQDSPDYQERPHTPDRSAFFESSDQSASPDKPESVVDQNETHKRPKMEREESKHEYTAAVSMRSCLLIRLLMRSSGSSG